MDHEVFRRSYFVGRPIESSGGVDLDVLLERVSASGGRRHVVVAVKKLIGMTVGSMKYVVRKCRTLFI
jgi:hypothetical protein